MARPAPIFVVGVARSGTTLLQALLGAHPHIAAPPEMHWFLRIYHQRDYWGELDSPAGIRRVVAATLDMPGGMLDDIRIDADDVMEHLSGADVTYPDVLAAVMTTYAERHGKKRWSEKTPHQSPDDIWHAFPHAQVLHIVRDPRDVVASVARAPFTNAGNGPSATARAWRDWNAAAMTAGHNAGPQQYLRVRYEDLCNDPESVMDRVFDFLGEPRVPGVADDLAARRSAVAASAWWTHSALHFVRPAPEPGRALGWGRRALVTRMTRAVLEELGYRTGTPTETAVGTTAYAFVKARDRLRRSPPAVEMSAAERHERVNALIDRMLSDAERSRPE
ncbi:MAG TPA: sulfotransferase [Mycobacteriales bacterium]|nr:sulfotransferase [Mycobacteriales bacterium]